MNPLLCFVRKGAASTLQRAFDSVVKMKFWTHMNKRGNMFLRTATIFCPVPLYLLTIPNVWKRLDLYCYVRAHLTNYKAKFSQRQRRIKGRKWKNGRTDQATLIFDDEPDSTDRDRRDFDSTDPDRTNRDCGDFDPADSDTTERDLLDFESSEADGTENDRRDFESTDAEGKERDCRDVPVGYMCSVSPACAR